MSLSRLRSDPLNEVLAYLALQNTGQLAPPIPRINRPIATLCQLVLRWARAGEKVAAATLSRSIPLDFPWMWCPENEYCEEKTFAPIAFLSRLLGRVEFSGGDPYFEMLSNNLSVQRARDINILDWFSIETEGLKCGLTFSGERTSLGCIVSDAAEIRAFGPQTLPLSDPMGFGIRSIAQHGSRWASPIASPEIWFEMKVRPEGAGILFDLSFFGLKPSAPLAFAFYVKADSAQIGSETLQPKTLKRYHGISKPVQFGTTLCIKSLTPGKMEVIPLAGSGGYWNSEYLAAFEIHPINAKMTFQIRGNKKEGFFGS